MVPTRIDELIAYALAVAGQADDWTQRELGPIHLVKYVYIGDLAHADEHSGDTYTGAHWYFHHYGPWTAEVLQRIEPTVQQFGASERRFESKYYENDQLRWQLRDDRLLVQLENQIPFKVARAIKRAVKDYGNDTTGLLHFVYTTRPMLRAAPEETLDFRPPPPVKPAPSRESRPPRSNKEEKRRKQAMNELRERVQRNLRERDPGLVPPTREPRYDDVFYDGVAWLDAMAGDTLEPQNGVLRFDDSVWKSGGRGGDPDDIS